VCTILRKRREKEINALALHSVQLMNELTGYRNSTSSPSEMLRKHTDYKRCDLYRRAQDDIRRTLKP
jgi:hypothetical protein